MSLWLIVMIAGSTAIGPLFDHMGDTSRLPGTETGQAQDAIDGGINHGVQFFAVIDNVDAKSDQNTKVLSQAVNDVSRISGVQEASGPGPSTDGRAAVISVTLVPALIPIFIRGRLKSEEDNWIVRSFIQIYKPLLTWALPRRNLVMWFFAAMLIVAAGIFPLQALLGMGASQNLPKTDGRWWAVVERMSQFFERLGQFIAGTAPFSDCRLEESRRASYPCE